MPDWGSGEEFLGPRFRFRLHKILKALPPPDGLWLDVACGLGGMAKKLQEKHYRVVGMDNHWGACRQTQQKGIPVIMGDIQHLPIRKGVLKGIVTSETLEHISDDHQAVQEFFRVLMYGGVVVLTVPAHEGQFSFWDTWAGHLRRYEKKDLLQLFHQFIPLSLQGFGFPFLYLYDRVFLRRFIQKRATEEKKSLSLWVVLKKIFAVFPYLLFFVELPSDRWNVGWRGVFMKGFSDRSPSTPEKP